MFIIYLLIGLGYYGCTEELYDILLWPVTLGAYLASLNNKK